MSERRYLPTFADLVDRMSICLLKSIFIPDHKETYQKEIADIQHDLDHLSPELKFRGEIVKAILVIMLTNRFIWENEAAARSGDSGEVRLRMTHSINGVRNTAKNVLSHALGDRTDLKTDCLAANLPKEFGNWAVWP